MSIHLPLTDGEAIGLRNHLEGTFEMSESDRLLLAQKIQDHVDDPQEPLVIPADKVAWLLLVAAAEDDQAILELATEGRQKGWLPA